MTDPPRPMTEPHRGRSLGVILTLLLLAGLLAGSYATRNGDPSLEYNAPPPLANTGGLVDQSPLVTARSLADQAATAPEREYGRQALQIADHEVDQAFAQALRQATEHAPPLTGAALATSRRIAQLTARVQAEQSAVQASNQANQANPGNPDAQLAQAQLAVDQDQLDDLRGDLIRLGGDRKARIQQALDQHEAVQKLNAARPPNTAAQQLESAEALRTLPGKIRAWSALGARATQLAQARQDAAAAAHRLAAQHDALLTRTEGQTAAGAPAPGAAAAAASVVPAATDQAGTLDRLHALASQRSSLAQFNQQIHDEQQLADIYTKWNALVVAQRTTVLHRIFRMLIIVVVLLGLMLAADRLIVRLFDRGAGGRRMHTMRIVLTVIVQVVGLGLILIVLFGTPQQTPTIIGLATAGITVVLKDFIVAFFGWFVLMGRNGVRVGDWVEINGVSGEVIELGIMRTVLLETGNWSESAQPTGRLVTFMNSYAIEGQFFNFSTSGQWLWDELRVTVPAGPAAYGKFEAIRRIVEERTAGEIAQAEKDWQRVSRNYQSAHFKATPSFDLRPTIEGIQLTARYITRAQDQAGMRAELNEKAIAILHFPERAGGAAGQQGSPPQPEVTAVNRT